MSTYPCPKNGCESTDPTWCSECGAQMQPGSTPAPSSPAATATTVVCPDCGTPRDGTDEYCGVCRYNFNKCKSYEATPSAPTASSSISSASVEIANAAAAATPPSPTAPATPATTGEPKGIWNIVIDFDPTIDPSLDPSTLTPRPQLTFPLDLPELAIGRKGSKNHPEIPIDDEGVSSRHAKIFFTPAGAPMIVDVNSTNGTLVNDQPLEPGLATPLESGASIKIGRWTRITVTGR